MTEKEQIRSLLKQAEMYRSQGLLAEAKMSYLKAVRIVKKSGTLAGNKDIIRAIAKRIRGIEKEIKEINEDEGKPELTPEVQALITKLFAFSKDHETAAIEGAVALAKFGQYDKALVEFKRLLQLGVLPLVAAKNILRCYLSLSSPESAVNQLKLWISENAFSSRYLVNLHNFLGDLFEKRGIDMELPEVAVQPSDNDSSPDKEMEILDISLVSIKLDNGPRKGAVMEYDVNFQTGNTISIMIPADQKDIIEALKPGTRLPEMQCYSLLAVFNGSGTVSGLNRIASGPKKGNYTLDVTINGS
ncbi:MAG: hypothetical protein JRH06_04575 [Deltaproteobacteria bacterium]|nr:hypothetical protein [Deltaproteobacteria bacterium]MBW2136815.1 hypothetical protein [Deltaproteobacteria bacterium]